MPTQEMQGWNQSFHSMCNCARCIYVDFADIVGETPFCAATARAIQLTKDNTMDPKG